MYVYFAIIIFCVLGAGSVQTAYAVPPPDFIFNIGSQIVQIFTFIVLGFSVVIGSFRRFFQSHPWFVRHGKLMWALLAVVVLGLSLAGAYFYEQYRQDQAYKQWVEESKQQSLKLPEEQGVSLDKLKVGELQAAVLPRGQKPVDSGEEFIKAYYNNLNAGNTEAAYAVSAKTVSYSTYKGWYKDTQSVTVDSVQKISENFYSLGLTLKETTGATRYAVLMRLKKTAAGEFNIENSQVRTLAQTQPEGLSPNSTGMASGVTSVFFEHNKKAPIIISNEDFQTKTAQKGAYVLDAREDEEYEVGYFPNSRHIRFADLLAGQWIELPQDREVYVLCWSGIRGKEVAEFLRSKNIVSRYLANGADGWVSFGGKWEGGIKFLSKYSAERYQTVFTTEQVKSYISQGVVIVDSRQPSSYQKNHMTGSIPIPTIYTPTSQMEKTLAQVPPNAAVITVCDDFVSCFDAKITGVKLEKKGHTFLGRYNKPWEYK